jgi:hypothetical protein
MSAALIVFGAINMVLFAGMASSDTNTNSIELNHRKDRPHSTPPAQRHHSLIAAHHSGTESLSSPLGGLPGVRQEFAKSDTEKQKPSLQAIAPTDPKQGNDGTSINTDKAENLERPIHVQGRGSPAGSLERNRNSDSSKESSVFSSPSPANRQEATEDSDDSMARQQSSVQRSRSETAQEHAAGAESELAVGGITNTQDNVKTAKEYHASGSKSTTPGTGVASELAHDSFRQEREGLEAAGGSSSVHKQEGMWVTVQSLSA